MSKLIAQMHMALAGFTFACGTTLTLAQETTPFPPGKNVELVKKVCTACHSATLVVDRRYDVAAAKKVYRLFVGNPDSEEGKMVVEYLTTALGE